MTDDKGLEIELPSGDYKPRGPRILVVDDDASLVHMLRENLELEGYQVSCGFDGQMAVQLARLWRPDLIILDLQMPLTNGLKAFNYLRALPETQTLPVIFLTGEQAKELVPVVATSYRVAHLKKPVDLAHLNATVRHFLQQYPIPH